MAKELRILVSRIRYNNQFIIRTIILGAQAGSSYDEIECRFFIVQNTIIIKHKIF